MKMKTYRPPTPLIIDWIAFILTILTCIIMLSNIENKFTLLIGTLAIIIINLIGGFIRNYKEDILTDYENSF